MQDSPLQNPIFPFHIHLKAAARTQSPDTPVLPFIRECRKQCDLLLMRLEQHLRNPGNASEVPVNLEGRMIVK